MGARAALYCRISTTDQRHDLQLDEVREHARVRGFEVVAEYQDTISGSRDRRPGLDALLLDARRHRFDTVLVWKLDRLGRSLRHLVLLLEELSQCGVSVIATSQGIDTSGALGRFVANLLGALGEMERELVVERTRAGLAAARRRGVRFGRPSVLTAEAAARVARLHNNGQPIRAIASLLGVSRGVVHREIVRLRALELA
jgi:DNA invertase Pin-like site-specific DNA recombinase